MKTFLYILTSQRNGDKDGVLVFGGDTYYNEQLLAVIDAPTAEDAAEALNLTIVDTWVRSSFNFPTLSTIYYTSKPSTDTNRMFFLFLKELEESDEKKYSNELEKKLRYKVAVSQNPSDT
jgi:hypothetical protein